MECAALSALWLNREAISIFELTTYETKRRQAAAGQNAAKAAYAKGGVLIEQYKNYEGKPATEDADTSSLRPLCRGFRGLYRRATIEKAFRRLLPAGR